MRGAAMLVGLVVITPIGFAGAIPAVSHPVLVLAGVDVGICSSVIPYVCDQLATFALLLALLPASATLIGVVVLGQIPNLIEVMGILLVAGGVVLHREG